VQVLPAAWGDTPYGYFSTWFSCVGLNDHGWFCDRRLDRQNRLAHSLAATNPRRAAALWAAIDRQLVDQAVWVSTVDGRSLDFLSARGGNYQFNPDLGGSPDQLTIRWTRR